MPVPTEPVQHWFGLLHRLWNCLTELHSFSITTLWFFPGDGGCKGRALLLSSLFGWRLVTYVPCLTRSMKAAHAASSSSARSMEYFHLFLRSSCFLILTRAVPVKWCFFTISICRDRPALSATKYDYSSQLVERHFENENKDRTWRTPEHPFGHAWAHCSMRNFSFTCLIFHWPLMRKQPILFWHAAVSKGYRFAKSTWQIQLSESGKRAQRRSPRQIHFWQRRHQGCLPLLSESISLCPLDIALPYFLKRRISASWFGLRKSWLKYWEILKSVPATKSRKSNSWF